MTSFAQFTYRVAFTRYNFSMMQNLTDADRQDRHQQSAWRGHLKLFYKISEEQYNELLDEQGGCCAICRRPQDYFRKRFAVDHNHETGKVRGLLCPNCNQALGHMRDDPHLFVRAAMYLKHYEESK